MVFKGRMGIVLGLSLLLPLNSAAEVSITSKPFSELAVYPQRSAPAEVVPLNDSLLAAEVAAVVEAIPVKVGDVVEPGALLVRLACGDYQRGLSRAKSELTALQAQANLAAYQLERARVLRKTNNVSEEVLNQREAEAAMAKARRDGQQAGLEQAQRDVERCSVAAPFRGVVVERRANVGELAFQGRELVRLVELDAVEVSARVQADEAAQLEGSTPFLEIGGKRYPTVVRRLLPVVDVHSRSREVRLLFDGDSAPPGSSGRLVWKAGQPHVPADLVVKRGDRYGVFLASQGRARFHPLERVEEGRPAGCDLPPDARLVIAGRFALRDGDPLREE